MISGQVITGKKDLAASPSIREAVTRPDLRRYPVGIHALPVHLSLERTADMRDCSFR